MDTQPGQVFIPKDGDPNQDQQQQPAAYAYQQAPMAQGQPPVPVAESSVGATTPQSISFTSGSSPLNTQEEDWRYIQESGMMGSSAEPLPNDVTWTAAEFVEHHKGAGWYGALALIAVVLAIGYYFVTKDYVFTAVIILSALMFGVYASRKPRTQQYHLSPDGVQVGEKMYGYHNFRNFSIAEDGAIANVIFMPLGRFAVPLTIYVSQDVEERVLGYLSLFLPFEQHSTDALDGLLRHIRF